MVKHVKHVQLISVNVHGRQDGSSVTFDLKSVKMCAVK